MLPAALQGLDRQQMTAAIKSAPLGRVDRKIALLRYVERLPLPDIAAQTHYSRTAISYRLKGIDEVEYTHFGEMCTESQRKNVYPLAFLFARIVV